MPFWINLTVSVLSFAIAGISVLIPGGLEWIEANLFVS